MSIKSNAAFIFLGLAVSSGASAAPAPQPGFDHRLEQLVKAEPGAVQCFVRKYDRAHMANHPKQTVTAVSLCIKVAYDTLNGDGRYQYDFEMRARQRNRAKILTSTGECGASDAPANTIWPPSGNISCGPACDGGEVEIQWEEKSSVLIVRLERIRMSLGCGGEEAGTVDLTGGADDRVFRLTKVPRSKAKI